MPVFRVHVIFPDLTSRKIDKETSSPKKAAELVAGELRASGEAAFKIGKTKLVRQ